MNDSVTTTPLPAAGNLSRQEILARIEAARKTLGERALLLCHHYQVDEIFRFADATGDSFKLARIAADRRDAEFIVFCGVHFMAESADILTSEDQVVLLPDLAAGCTMADMANLDQTETAWEALLEAGGDDLVPVTYMNSSAAIKAFCGRNGGVVCTSSNALAVLEWAWSRKRRVLFLPDEHLGRNMAWRMGVPLEEMSVWDPMALAEENLAAGCDKARLILWKGFCSVHGRFLPEHVDQVRQRIPGVQVIAHPECSFEVLERSDHWGSTEKIIKTISEAPAGSRWAVGTEFNLVSRLARLHPDKTVVSLSGINCLCSTMYRIDPAHLMLCLEGLLEGRFQHRISVPEDVREDALTALDRMLALA